MKHQNLSYFSVGLFVILMFVALMGTLYYLTGRTGAAEDYFVYYQDVAGLEKGSPVTYRGYRVGRVDRIKPDFDDNQVRYQVTLSIRKGWPLSADSTARILSSGLLAAVHIDIQGGSSPEMLEPGATLAGREAVSLFAALDSIAAEADHLVDDGIMPVLKNLNDRINGIADPLQAGAETVMEDFKVAAATLKTKVGGLSGDVETLVQRLNNSAAALEQAFDEKNLEHFDAFMEKMDTTAGNLKTLSQDLDGSRARLDGLLANADGVVTDNREELRKAVNDLRQTMAVIAQHVDAVTYNLKLTSRNMAEFSRLIRQNPGLLLSGRSVSRER